MTAYNRHRLGRRDANEAEIIDALRSHGCSVVQLDHPTDLLVGRIRRLPLGVNFLLEVKDPAKKPSERRLTERELEFAESWRGQYAVVETVSDALAAVGLARGENGTQPSL